MAIGEVGSYVDLLQLHPIPQDSSSKIARAGLGKLECKRDHYDHPDPEFLNRDQFLAQSLDLSGRIVGRQYLKGMWIKGYYRGRSSDFLRPAHQVEHQLPVTSMHAVKIPDRSHRSRAAMRQLIQPVEYLHALFIV